MLHDVYTPDLCIKFQLPKHFFFLKKKMKIGNFLVFFFLVFLRAKINIMVLIESNSKFGSPKREILKFMRGFVKSRESLRG
jgi:hypothetical protein